MKIGVYELNVNNLSLERAKRCKARAPGLHKANASTDIGNVVELGGQSGSRAGQSTRYMPLFRQRKVISYTASVQTRDIYQSTVYASATDFKSDGQYLINCVCNEHNLHYSPFTPLQLMLTWEMKRIIDGRSPTIWNYSVLALFMSALTLNFSIYRGMEYMLQEHNLLQVTI